MKLEGAGTKGRLKGCDIARNRDAGVAVLNGAEGHVISCK